MIGEVTRGIGENSYLDNYEESSRMGMFFMGLVESAKNKLQKNETSQQIVSEKLFPSTKNTAHCYCSKADLANSRAFVVFPQFMV